jgi:hypothetical protein
MYKEGELLEVTEPFGKGKGKIEKGTMVEFYQVIDGDDLKKALIAVKLGDRVLVTLETNVRIKSWWRRRKAFKAFNNQMMLNNPRLRRYSPNPFVKAFFRVYYFLADKVGKNV